jgi:E3 ubiquitin-protein ligase DOA10
MEQFCRICYETSDTSKLIEPCACTGSVKHVHVQCLIKWILVSRKTNCELCGERYLDKFPDSKTQVTLRVVDTELIVRDLIYLVTIVVAFATAFLRMLLNKCTRHGR